LSAAGLALLKRAEACSFVPYPDAVGQSIGYGHFIQPHEDYLLDGIDQATADRLLRDDTLWAQVAVNRLVKTCLPQDLFDALVDVACAIGERSFKRSRLLVLLNQGQLPASADEMRAWSRASRRVDQALMECGENEPLPALGSGHRLLPISHIPMPRGARR
jgi:GH24 family phage-related lysozyme (muramidase)